jgi:hypothetical protein
MSLLDQLPGSVIKTEPDVWVRRLVLFSRLTPKPEVIRDIPLHRGLNIVWAEEPDSPSDTSDIAGHSAGKTTFCRLLRYVLGEKTYAKKSATLAIRGSFPNGYVGAELVIGGSQWAVIRPLGENRNSWILRSGTVEEVVQNKGEPAYQDTYPEQLGLTRLLDSLASATVVRTQEEIKWGHLLAWCARDQEARFQNVYEWRSPRSDSEWPAFRFPKADPLFVMRILLGLYLRDELGTEEIMSRNLRDLDKAEVDLERMKREPEFWRRHHHARLLTALQLIFPTEKADIDQAPLRSNELVPDLKRYVDKAKFTLSDGADLLHKEAATNQAKLNDITERIAEARLELRQIEALFSLGQKATGEIQTGLAQKEEERRLADELKHRVCPVGGVLVGECSYVKNRQNRLQPGQVRQTHALEQMEAERSTEQEGLKRQQNELRARIEADEKNRDRLQADRQQQIEKIRSLGDEGTILQDDLDQLFAWDVRLQSPDKNEKMRVAIAAIDELRRNIETDKESLNQLLAKHDSNSELLNRIFSESARRVLPSASYDGVVSFEDRELSFQIMHGGAMSGEAVESLTVLLADFSCLLFNLLSKESHLPGFLLHDSPREADLGLRLYYSFINFVAEVAATFEKQGECPFQYILTTTTPPPRTANDKRYLVLRLDASKEEGLLFRRDLSRNPDDEQLALPAT